MYIECLKEDKIPWRQRWSNNANRNGITGIEYKGVNKLILQLVSYMEHYEDPRWLTFFQIKSKGYKLNDSKGKGVPVEFWSIYDMKNKKKLDVLEYEKIIQDNPELKRNYKIICKTSYVFNASLIEGIPSIKNNKSKNTINTSMYIEKIIKKLRVGYKEFGNQAFYNPQTDEIVLPPKNAFIDKYSYYATQLHELCHSTGNKKRLNRNMGNNNIKEYAREELIAEISSSFLMQQLDIVPTSEHYDNHKTYIKSWIEILEDKPNELFKAINESDKVCNYINDKIKNKMKDNER